MTGLRIEKLEQKLGLKKSKIYLLIQKGLLPRPRKIGTASIWLEAEIEAAFRILLSGQTKTPPKSSAV